MVIKPIYSGYASKAMFNLNNYDSIFKIKASTYFEKIRSFRDYIALRGKIRAHISCEDFIKCLQFALN